MKRIFAAVKIDPGENLTELLYSLKKRLKHDKINWVQLHNMHITLKFFGETHEDEIPGICSHLTEIASQNTSFDLTLRDTGVFGSYYKPSVIWIGIEPNSALIKLGTDVLDRMDNIGYKKDRQNFVPHLTLGRIKYTSDKSYFNEVIEDFKNLAIQSQSVDSFHLIESKLSSEGPEYTTIESFSLQ